MMESERLAETLYKAWLASDKDRPATSYWKPQPWLELATEERNRWREVAEAGLRFTATVEDWHGKVSR